MKNIYTRNDIQRMATEKAIEILTNEKDMMLTNISYGWSNGDCLIGLSNDNRYGTRKYYVVLESKGSSWSDEIYDLAVYKEVNKECELIEVIDRFYGIRSKCESVYITDEEGYKKHIERRYEKYRTKDKHWNIKKGSELNLKLKERIKKDTGKKIKNQDLIVRKRNNGYVIKYEYRNVSKNIFI